MSHPPGTPQELFLPALTVEDEAGAFWLRQITWRLRREIAWLWHERGWNRENSEKPPAGIPPATDRVIASLDLARYADQKARFFETDVTAIFLSDLINKRAPDVSLPRPGSFGWVVKMLGLSEVDAFVLALALLPIIDSAAGNIIAACLNDGTRTQPTLALAQRLWDKPRQLLAFLDSAHPLISHGLLQPGPVSWDTPFVVPGLAARCLLWNDTTPGAIHPQAASLDPLALARLRSAETRPGTRLAPLLGPRGSNLQSVAHDLAAALGKPLLAPTFLPGQTIAGAATLAWLQGAILFFPFEAFNPDATSEPVAWPLPALPITVLVGLKERTQLRRLTEHLRLPEIEAPELGYEQRLSLWQQHLPHLAGDPLFAPTLSEISRRFRCGPERIAAAARDLSHLNHDLTREDLIAACRADVDLGELAQPVRPRFNRQDLQLEPKASALLNDLIHAMRALTAVHYQWGTARPWNEAGLSALFAGPPGTGKTMAAEVIAAELALPLYRIDLSQVVNKFIGETEKNLRRLFDTAEQSDAVLFFDEADAIFGKRTEVRDSHDRYANLEISYLLERMERFKGLAILATNRKKDLDEAFLRRLRWVIDFELPGEAERHALWRQCIPPQVDATLLSLPTLAARFPMTGGHIRSVVFNACLKACEPGGSPRLTMPQVLDAVRQEYEKLGRKADPDLFT